MRPGSSPSCLRRTWRHHTVPISTSPAGMSPPTTCPAPMRWLPPWPLLHSGRTDSAAEPRHGPAPPRLAATQAMWQRSWRPSRRDAGCRVVAWSPPRGSWVCGTSASQAWPGWVCGPAVALPPVTTGWWALTAPPAACPSCATTRTWTSPPPPCGC